MSVKQRTYRAQDLSANLSEHTLKSGRQQRLDRYDPRRGPACQQWIEVIGLIHITIKNRYIGQTLVHSRTDTSIITYKSTISLKKESIRKI